MSLVKLRQPRPGTAATYKCAESGESEGKRKRPGAEVQSGAFSVLGSEVGEDLTNSTAIAGHCCESSEAEEGEGGGFGDGLKGVEII